MLLPLLLIDQHEWLICNNFIFNFTNFSNWKYIFFHVKCRLSPSTHYRRSCDIISGISCYLICDLYIIHDWITWCAIELLEKSRDMLLYLRKHCITANLISGAARNLEYKIDNANLSISIKMLKIPFQCSFIFCGDRLIPMTMIRNLFI